MRVRNTDVHSRVWLHLVNQETGRTLELAPDEEAEVSLPEGLQDPHLMPVRRPAKAARSGEESALTDKED